MVNPLPRRRRSAATRLVLTAALAAAVIVPLTQAHAAAPVPLTATTVLNGPGFADVVLAKPVKIRDVVAAVKVGQPGNLGGIALIRNQRTPRPPGIVVVHAGADGSALRYVWMGTATGTKALTDKATLLTRTLPAGVYRLAVAGKAPLAVTWALPGLTAKTTRLRLSGVPGFIAQRDVAPGVDGVAVAPSTSATVTFAGKNPFALAALLEAKTVTGSVAEVGGCLNDMASPTTTVDSLVTPAPACAGSDSELATAGPLDGGQISGYAKSGSWFAKAYERVEGVATELRSSVVAIDLGPGFQLG